MKLSRRTLLQYLAAAGCPGAAPGLVNASEASEAYPTKEIRLVVPKPPGGGFDTIARVLSEQLSIAWKQPVIVDNRPGASDMLGAAVVAKSRGDGYTLFLGASGLTLNPVLYPKMPYDTAELTPLVKLHEIPFALVVPTSLGVSSLQEFIALAKKEKGKLSYGTISPTSQALGQILEFKAGISLIGVPYKGEQPALVDLLGGQVTSAFLAPATALRYPGKLTMLAISGDKRFPGTAAPTMSESGFPDLKIVSWGGIFAPSSTPKPVLVKIATEFERIGRLPIVVQKSIELGFNPSVSGPVEFAPFVQNEFEFWRRISKQFTIVPG